MIQREHIFSHYVDALLDRIMVEPCWFTAVDHSGAAIGKSDHAQMAWHQRRKAMGIKPAHLDWYVYQRPIYAQFELKVGRGDLKDGQRATMRLLEARGIPTGCAWTIPQVYRLLVDAGFVLHGNAENIMLEVDARCQAALAGVDGPRKRAAGKPQEKKASAARIARAHAAGVWS